jgi:hypothetical protein
MLIKENVIKEALMPHRKILILLSIFNATVNTLYLVRFFGVLPPEEIVYGYVPWFMSFTLPNIFMVILSWILVYSLLKGFDKLAVLSGLLVSGALIFHALNGLMFGFYTGSFLELSLFNAVFEVVVYVYGLSLATFYIIQFWKVIDKSIK